MNRIEFLRDKVFNGNITTEEFMYHFYKSYENNSELSEFERYGEAFYNALSNLTPSIFEGELIVGRFDLPLTGEEKKEWNEKYSAIALARQRKAGGGQDSHMAIDYELLLSKGITGVIERINSLKISADREKTEFYNCCIKCLEAVIHYSERYSEAALKLSRETENPQTKAELERIAQICKNVPKNPASSFYEAVQSVHFITHCESLNPYRTYSLQFQLGHPDRYLLPYYEKDIASGEITREKAQLLLDCLGIQINMRVSGGLSSGYMVGGRDSDGEIVQNELTEICMQVVDDIRLVYPAVGLCHTEGMDDKYLDKACELLAKGHSHPAIFNDDIITSGLEYYGVPKEEAHNYIHSTCVEITPVASSNVWVASPYTNMPLLLLNVMDKEYSTFEELKNAFFEKLDSHIKANFEAENYTRKIRNENSINPLLSCFVNDCLAKGKDIEQGGARYNWIMPSFVGMANLVDSLYAINQLVYKEKRLTVTEFKAALDKNYEGNEALRLYIQNKIDKYGNDIDEVDSYFSPIAEHLTTECEKYTPMHSNGKLIPSVFCWIMHESFGRETGATPDGRTAGFPLGDGSGPCQGRELNGPTASVLSSTKWDHRKFIGGVAVNMKFSKSSLGSKSLNTIKSVVKAYLKRSGFEIQINVVDNETLRKAQQNPEEYRDLIVRIGGYSNYFVNLSKEMQEEIILRTTHNA